MPIQATIFILVSDLKRKVDYFVSYFPFKFASVSMSLSAVLRLLNQCPVTPFPQHMNDGQCEMKNNFPQRRD